MGGYILDLKTAADLGRLKPSDFVDRDITLEEFTHMLRLQDAFWQYPGEPRPEQPHALTKAGKCTDGFIDLLRLLRLSNLCEILAGQLLKKVREVTEVPFQWVVSAAYAGIDLGHEVARQAGVIHAFVEKDAKANPTVWSRHTIEEGEVALIVNELMTTDAGSTFETKEAVRTGNKVQPVQFLPVVGVLVNRSADADTLKDGTLVAAFARYHMSTYEPGAETCRYCAAGSPSIKPKIEGNWEKYFGSA